MTYTPSPAGFWKRYVAYFIDILILYVMVEILSTVYFSFQAYSQIDVLTNVYHSLKAGSETGVMPDPYSLIHALKAVLLPSLIFSSCAYFIIAGIYFCAAESSVRQASIGKRLLGIKVTNLNGEPIKLPQAIGRYLAASLSWITLNLGHALAAWTPQRRALHDYLAQTRVENVDPGNTRMPVWARVVIALHVLFFICLTLLMVLSIWLLLQMRMTMM
ncbi:MAG: RDD family protein [Arenimonas sp.]